MQATERGSDTYREMRDKKEGGGCSSQCLSLSRLTAASQLWHSNSLFLSQVSILAVRQRQQAYLVNSLEFNWPNSETDNLFFLSPRRATA